MGGGGVNHEGRTWCADKEKKQSSSVKISHRLLQCMVGSRFSFCNRSSSSSFVPGDGGKACPTHTGQPGWVVGPWLGLQLQYSKKAAQKFLEGLLLGRTCEDCGVWSQLRLVVAWLEHCQHCGNSAWVHCWARISRLFPPQLVWQQTVLGLFQ